ncbi:MAG: glucose-6-phosphate dehydrogenase (NADP(+)) [Bacteroidetes bacterium]|nr:glucose-6-phosphate dehydrogenase (NADP(+)) [Bacteroidota bacterium]
MRQIIVQFGGTGDLAQKKLYPAYLNLLNKGYDITIIALGRRYPDRETFISKMGITYNKDFLKHLEYVQYDMADSKGIEKLEQKIDDFIDCETNIELLYYIALQPSLYEEAIKQIKIIDSHITCSVSKKIVVEKPFGFDSESAQRYNEVLSKAFTDKEIYRIDHYLGKEFMQNLLIMRFHNDIIRSIWNNRTIESIQIIFDETHGVDQRLGFYEKIGVVRDTIQNHILQIVTYLTMSEPASFSPEDIATEKIKVLRSIKPIQDYRLGRYESLGAGSGHSLNTPTYAALKLHVNTFYYAGIPIYIRTGKMQKKAVSQIYVKFKNTTKTVMNDSEIMENGVIINIHPELTIDISMNLKEPNTSWKSKPVKFRFNHSETFGVNTPEAYEQIVEKILQSDKSLFPSMREILESWRIVNPMLHDTQDIEIYPAHSLPKFAKEMMEKDNLTWFA